MSKQTEALKLALEALETIRQPLRINTSLDAYDVGRAIIALREALADQPAQQQEPVSCHVCNEVHTILDADDSKIIRNAADGYPDGRASRVLTLQERVTALCVYAADWRRWCLEKENAPPASKPWVGLTDAERDDIWERHHTTLGGWDYGGDDVMYDRHFEPAVADIEAKLREKNA